MVSRCVLKQLLLYRLPNITRACIVTWGILFKNCFHPMGLTYKYVHEIVSQVRLRVNWETSLHNMQISISRLPATLCGDCSFFQLGAS